MVTASNTFYIIGLYAIYFFAILYLLLITRRIAFNKLRKLFLPALVFYTIAITPLFSAYNLSRIEWLPQISLYSYDIIDGENYSVFSYLYYKLIPYLSAFLAWSCVGIFLSYIRNKTILSKPEEILLFVPFLNLILITKSILKQDQSTLQKIIISFFILCCGIHWFYKLVAPFLFLNEWDTFSWYVSLFYDEWDTSEQGYYSYVMATDLMTHFNATTPYLVALISIPTYLILDRFKLTN